MPLPSALAKQSPKAVRRRSSGGSVPGYGAWDLLSDDGQDGGFLGG